MLKDLRKNAGLTQVEIAKKLGIAQTTYSALENGKALIPDDQVKQLSEIFNVDEAEIKTTPYVIDALNPTEQSFYNITRNFNGYYTNHLTLSLIEYLNRSKNLVDPAEAVRQLSQLIGCATELLSAESNPFGTYDNVSVAKKENAKNLFEAATKDFISFCDAAEMDMDAPF